MKAPVEVIGSVVVDLKAASDARETDFMALRRYRNGYDREELLNSRKGRIVVDRLMGHLPFARGCRRSSCLW